MVEVIETYFSAWNELDASRRLRLLERCWISDGELYDPSHDGPAIGPGEICDFITSLWRERIPEGARFQPVSRVERHNGVFRYVWALVGSTGEMLRDGVDTGRLAPDGRLALVVTFFGQVPP
jgi:hypothetical protein